MIPFCIAGHFGTGKTVMGGQAVLIKRAKYLEAGLKVDVHAFVYSNIFKDLHSHLQNLFSGINANVGFIEPGKYALKKTVKKLLEGMCEKDSHKTGVDTFQK